MSESIIFDLKEDHKNILALFREIDETAILEEKKKLLEELKRLLVEHLHKEDTEIYPILLHSEDQEVLALGNNFLISMTGYTEMFLNVSEKMLQSVVRLEQEVVREYEQVRDKIKDRVFVEEIALFPAYEREQSKQ